jgi:hypothetical protein
MAKAEITVHIADLPIVQAKLAELDRIAAALRDEQPFPRTEVGDAIHNLRGRAETAEHALASLRERVLALAGRHEECCGVVNIASLREAVRGES